MVKNVCNSCWEVVDLCDECDDDLSVGDDLFCDEGHCHYCSRDCYIGHVIPNGVVTKDDDEEE